jgi:hypothetical protein
MDMYKWLCNHKEINRSKLFRDAVRFKQKNIERKISPLVFLASIMGICFSVVLIGISLTPSPIGDPLRAILGLLGGILAVATMIVYVKERKSVK